MLIEAVESPIRYQWPEGEIFLVPGLPVYVQPERAVKVLKKCGDRVRRVDLTQNLDLCNGDMVEFLSPLFGVCTGRVLSVEVETVRIGEHSVVKEIVKIPRLWITKIFGEQAG